MHAATDIPLEEPTEVVAGNTITWRREDLTDHDPADEWSLAYHAFGLKGKFDISASADGEDFAITVSASASAAFQEGEINTQVPCRGFFPT